MRGTTSSVGVVGVTAWRHFWNKASPGRVQGDKLQNMAGIIEKIWLDDQLMPASGNTRSSQRWKVSTQTRFPTTSTATNITSARTTD